MRALDNLMGNPMAQLEKLIPMHLNHRAIDEGTLEIDGVCRGDYPDFVDTYFMAASFNDGTELTDLELEQLTSDYPETLNEMAFESFH